MRFIGYLVLFAVIAYGIYPYYFVYRIDGALGKDDTEELSTLVDLDAIRANYKRRAEASLGGTVNPGSANAMVDWLRQNLERLGDSALSQAITLGWVRDSLRDAARQATNQSPPYLLAGITFAFFESYDTFLVRIGELGMGEVHFRMAFKGKEWRITDIIR